MYSWLPQHHNGEKVTVKEDGVHTHSRPVQGVRYCKGTKENDISKCTKSVLNNGKWAKYGKNRENRKYSNS